MLCGCRGMRVVYQGCMLGDSQQTDCDAGMETCAEEIEMKLLSPTLLPGLHSFTDQIMLVLDLHSITQDYTGLHMITQDYTGLHWITLDYTGLNWITQD